MQREANDEFAPAECIGVKGLLLGVLTRAVQDLRWNENQKVTIGIKLDAARWLLGIGEENGGGFACADAASVLGIDQEVLAEKIGAREKLQELVQTKASRHKRRAGADMGMSVNAETY